MNIDSSIDFTKLNVIDFLNSDYLKILQKQSEQIKSLKEQLQKLQKEVSEKDFQ